jgi:branched-chain amino acid transport system ATP-binding protein
MARILDKFLPDVGAQLIKATQEYDFVKSELDSLDEIYEEKKAEKLLSFRRKANKDIQKAAFLASDKEEYINLVNEKKLQKFDIKNYMQYRAANTKCANALYKKELSVEEIFASHSSEIEKIRRDREEYIQKLSLEKDAFLKKNAVTDSTKYDALCQTLKAKYDAYEAKLTDELNKKKEQKRARLNARFEALSKKVDELKGKCKSNYKLPDDVLVEVKGLKMYFGGLKAVDDLSFNVKKGEIFGLIGPNGAGKTTVFNCITQFYKPTGGEVHFATNGEVISLTDYKVHDIVLKGISRTFQNIEVVKEVSVLDNLLIAATRYYTSNLFVQMFNLPRLKREEKIMRMRADKVLKDMDLYSYRDRLAWGLPYGVLKRIEIARALMCNPSLIILDEPAAGLNESETRELAELIKKIRDDFGCTVLLVEHDMGLVMSICDHICAISFGKKLADGTPLEIQSSKEVQEAYLGVEEE